MNHAGDGLQSHDVIVVGGGPAGLTSALALARAGANTALVARRAPYADNRTTALLGASVDLLEGLDVWRRCEAQSAALRVMRLVDDTGRLVRAPEVRFTAGEIGLEAFGYNIENRSLMAALESAASEFANLRWIDDEAEAVEPGESNVRVIARQGTVLSARLVVGADGRRSLCRDAAGIAVRARGLKQSALTFNVEHSRPHHGISTEFHTSHGPCVFVPLPGNRSSVVWVSMPAEAEKLAGLSGDALAQATEKQAHSTLGKFRVGDERHLFPLSIEQPLTFAQRRVALVGEAAHVLPPIGAQGLNIGLRDAADIADIVGNAISSGDDPGAPAMLSRFGLKRRSDVATRMIAIELANRSLLSDFLPAQVSRAAGLHLLGAVGPVRRIAMREGLGPFWRRSPSTQTRRNEFAADGAGGAKPRVGPSIGHNPGLFDEI